MVLLLHIPVDLISDLDGVITNVWDLYKVRVLLVVAFSQHTIISVAIVEIVPQEKSSST